jgi:hypothetical protein
LTTRTILGKFLNTYFSPLHCYRVPPRPKYFYQHSILNTLSVGTVF